VLVARDGKVAYHRAAGLADREAGKPMGEDTIFNFSSVTKPLVTAAVMKLIEQGRIRRAWAHSFVPMGMMAGGSLGLIIAARHGPISIVTPLIGSYPVVTLIYARLVLKERITRLQYGCIASILTGMALCSV
jgi:drug/metabolite transporter (DMT)-like permease